MKPIIVAGDICQDVYLYSYMQKDNPEHASKVYVVDKKIVRPGMAQNVYLNCLAMNSYASLMHNSQEPYIQKTRLYYNDEYISRVDNDNYLPKHKDEDLEAMIQYNKHNYDAIIVCDYGKNFWNKDRLQLLNNTKAEIFIDPYTTTPLSYYPKCTAIVPNYKEGCLFTGLKDPLEICKDMAKEVDCKYVILKMGEKGAIMYTKGMDEALLFPADKVAEVDVCGCGDSFIAALATLYLQGFGMAQCVQGANKIAAITVQHSGVYVPTPEDFQNIKKMLDTTNKIC